MQKLARLFGQYKALTALFVGFVALYVWNIVTAEPSRLAIHRYHVTGTQMHQVALTVAVPYIAIWIIGLVGYMWLHNYVKALGDSKDGAAFRKICNGILLLVFWLPLTVILSGLCSRYYNHHPEATASLIRIQNYFNVILLLPAFYLIYQGSKILLEVAKQKTQGLTQRQCLWFMIFTALYVFIALSDTVRQAAHGDTTVATYYLPDWLTLLTILIPRLITWFIGFAAVANIILYRQKVKGAIYKEALRHMAIGLGVIVVAITILRIIQSLSSVLGSLSLGLLLLLVYVLLLILGAGYLMVARGARRLLKIEES